MNGSGPSPTGRRRPVVLVVEDDRAIRRLATVVLEDEGFGVLAAGDGQEALAALEQAHVDVVVLDLQMPVMDGWTFFRQLREQGWQTPVLIVSAHGARQAHAELGAEDWLAKPFDLEVLVSRVQSLAGADGRAPAAAEV